MNKFITQLPPNWKSEYPLLIPEIEAFQINKDTYFLGEMFREYKEYVADTDHQSPRDEYEKKIKADASPIDIEDIKDAMQLWDDNFQRGLLLQHLGLISNLPILRQTAKATNIEIDNLTPEQREQEYHAALHAKQGLNAILWAIQLGKDRNTLEKDIRNIAKYKDAKRVVDMFYTPHNFAENKPTDRPSYPKEWLYDDERAWNAFSYWVEQKRDFVEQEKVNLSQLIQFRVINGGMKDLFLETNDISKNPFKKAMRSQLDLLCEIGEYIWKAPGNIYTEYVYLYFCDLIADVVLDAKDVPPHVQTFVENKMFHTDVLKDKRFDDYRERLIEKGYISTKKIVNWIQSLLITRKKEINVGQVDRFINKPHYHQALVEIANKQPHAILSDIREKSYFRVEAWAWIYQVRHDIKPDVHAVIENTLHSSSILQRFFCERWFARKTDEHKCQVLQYFATRHLLAEALEIENDSSHIFNQPPLSCHTYLNLNDSKGCYLHLPDFESWLLNPEREVDYSHEKKGNRGLRHLLALFPKRHQEILHCISDGEEPHLANVGKDHWPMILEWLQEDYLGISKNEDLHVLEKMARDVLGLEDDEDVFNYVVDQLIHRLKMQNPVYEDLSDTMVDDSWIP